MPLPHLVKPKSQTSVPFPGGCGRIPTTKAMVVFPLWRHKVYGDTCYALAFRKAQYWLRLSTGEWEVISTLQLRANYEPANKEARDMMAKHLAKHRRRMGFRYQRQQAHNQNDV